MRPLILLALLFSLPFVCGGCTSEDDGRVAQNSPPSTADLTRGAATGDTNSSGADNGTATSDTTSTADGASMADGTATADATDGGREAGQSAPDSTVTGSSDTQGSGGESPEEPCVLNPTMCPNACTGGDNAEGAQCVTDKDCACGFCCGFGLCRPFDGLGCEAFAAYASCLCPGDTPDDGPIDPHDEIPWQVDPLSYMDECDTLTPQGSECNPFCQLGCPANSHCALVDNERFLCVTSGAGSTGGTCENSSECSPWLSCFATFDETTPSCRQVCDADEECPSGDACNLTIQLSSALTVSFCDTALLSCNIWMPDCPQEMKCVAVAGKTICTESTWDGIEGYPCTELGDCGDGLLCVGSSCATICSLADEIPLGATSCAEQCPAGYQTVDQTLGIGRCTTGG